MPATPKGFQQSMAFFFQGLDKRILRFGQVRQILLELSLAIRSRFQFVHPPFEFLCVDEIVPDLIRKLDQCEFSPVEPHELARATEVCLKVDQRKIDRLFIHPPIAPWAFDVRSAIFVQARIDFVLQLVQGFSLQTFDGLEPLDRDEMPETLTALQNPEAFVICLGQIKGASRAFLHVSLFE